MDVTVTSDFWGQFKYQKWEVRCIGWIDISTALLQLAFLGMGKYTLHLYTILNMDENNFHIIYLIMFLIYTQQLMMGVSLRSASYKVEKEHVLSTCRKWYFSSRFLNICNIVEMFIFFFCRDRDLYQECEKGTLILITAKFFYRLIANYLVKKFIRQLRPPTPIIFSLSRRNRASQVQMSSQRNRHLLRNNPSSSVYGEWFTPPLTSISVYENLEIVPVHETQSSVPVDNTVTSTSIIEISLPAYEAPPSYNEATRDKNLRQSFNEV